MVLLPGICSIGKLFKSVGGAQSAAIAPMHEASMIAGHVISMRMKERFMETSLAAVRPGASSDHTPDSRAPRRLNTRRHAKLLVSELIFIGLKRGPFFLEAGSFPEGVIVKQRADRE
jgi:hypothetical protein